MPSEYLSSRVDHAIKQFGPPKNLGHVIQLYLHCKPAPRLHEIEQKLLRAFNSKRWDMSHQFAMIMKSYGLSKDPLFQQIYEHYIPSVTVKVQEAEVAPVKPMHMNLARLKRPPIIHQYFGIAPGVRGSQPASPTCSPRHNGG